MLSVDEYTKIFNTTPTHVLTVLKENGLRAHQTHQHLHSFNWPCPEERDLAILSALKSERVTGTITRKGIATYWLDALLSISSRRTPMGKEKLIVPIYSIYESLVKSDSLSFKLPVADICSYPWYIFNAYPWNRIYVCSQAELKRLVKSPSQVMLTRRFKLAHVGETGSTLQECLPQMLRKI